MKSAGRGCPIAGPARSMKPAIVTSCFFFAFIESLRRTDEDAPVHRRRFYRFPGHRSPECLQEEWGRARPEGGESKGPALPAPGDKPEHEQGLMVFADGVLQPGRAFTPAHPIS